MNLNANAPKAVQSRLTTTSRRSIHTEMTVSRQQTIKYKATNFGAPSEAATNAAAMKGVGPAMSNPFISRAKAIPEKR